MSGEPKRYAIETVADFDDVPDDKIEECLADFGEYVAMRRLCLALVDPGVARLSPVFHWVDDNVRGVSKFRFTDEDTGEEILSLDVGKSSHD